MRALLIKSPWIDKILAGEKTWEIRGSRTKIRGPIALIRSGSGQIVGVAELVDCLGPLSLDEMLKNVRKHRVDAARLKDNGMSYKTTHAWVLKNAQRLDDPIPYKHPSGAIIWVDLDKAMTPQNRRVLCQLMNIAQSTL